MFGCVLSMIPPLTIAHRPRRTIFAHTQILCPDRPNKPPQAPRLERAAPVLRSLLRQPRTHPLLRARAALTARLSRGGRCPGTFIHCLTPAQQAWVGLLDDHVNIETSVFGYRSSRWSPTSWLISPAARRRCGWGARWRCAAQGVFCRGSIHEAPSVAGYGSQGRARGWGRLATSWLWEVVFWSFRCAHNLFCNDTHSSNGKSI
jgi:hypothetical protein